MRIGDERDVRGWDDVGLQVLFLMMIFLYQKRIFLYTKGIFFFVCPDLWL